MKAVLEIGQKKQKSQPRSKSQQKLKTSKESELDQEQKEYEQLEIQYYELLKQVQDGEITQESNQTQKQRKSKSHPRINQKEITVNMEDQKLKARPKKQSKQISSLQDDFSKLVGQPLNKIKVYIEVYDGPSIKAQNMSNIFEELMMQLGATVMKRLTTTTNVMIWQLGTLRSLEKAKEFPSLKIVNTLWTDHCVRINGVAEVEPYLLTPLPDPIQNKLIERDKILFKFKKDSQNQMSLEERILYEQQERRANIYFIPVLMEVQSQLHGLRGKWGDQYVSLEQLAAKSQTSRPQSKNLNTSSQQNRLHIAFHKSIYPEVIKKIEDLKNEEDQPLFKIMVESEQFKASILIIGPKIIYDFLFCYFLIKNKQIAKLEWCQKILELKAPVDIDQYLIQPPTDIPKDLFWPFYFNIYQKQDKQRDPKELEETAKNEEIIKFYGGRVLKMQFADICLIIQNINKRQIASIEQRNSKIKIIRIQWIYQSIHEKKLAQLDQFGVN